MKNTRVKRLGAHSPQRVSISNIKKRKPPLPSDGLIAFVLMKKYKHLTREQKYAICLEWQKGQCMELIALTIGVHKFTVSRELKRNSTTNGKYVWKEAKSLAKTVWRLLLPYKGDALKTIITDNGSEFAEHEWIIKK